MPRFIPLLRQHQGQQGETFSHHKALPRFSL
jgi:hypothetical protein